MINKMLLVLVVLLAVGCTNKPQILYGPDGETPMFNVYRSEALASGNMVIATLHGDNQPLAGAHIGPSWLGELSPYAEAGAFWAGMHELSRADWGTEVNQQGGGASQVQKQGQKQKQGQGQIQKQQQSGGYQGGWR